MSDVLSKKQRSYCMSKIRGHNTKPELSLRKELWSRGLRYRIHSKVIGKPDLVFIGAKVAVFVDGCYWHGCPKHFVQPKSNTLFWENKINKNIERDKKVTQQLEAKGWRVIRIWEHEIKQDLDGCVRRVMEACRRD